MGRASAARFIGCNISLPIDPASCGPAVWWASYSNQLVGNSLLNSGVGDLSAGFLKPARLSLPFLNLTDDFGYLTVSFR